MDLKHTKEITGNVQLQMCEGTSEEEQLTAMVFKRVFTNTWKSFKSFWRNRIQI